MATRIDRTATLISAGAGFGKSTLIAQTLADPVTASTVRYVTHRVGPTDVDGAELERSLARQIGAIAEDVRHLDDAADSAATASGGEASDAPSDVSLADQLWHLSPEYVTVVVDDIHLLPASSAGWDILNDLVLDLPENADAILSGRGFHELRTARLIARGEAIEITEAMLAFNADELEDFARLRNVDASSLDEHGWPALVELEAHAGIAGAQDFVAQEVLGELPPEHVAALRSVALHETIDDELVEAVTDFHGTADDLFAVLPLTTQNSDGTWTLHDLWRTVLTNDIDDAERRASLVAGAEILRRRGHLREAIAETVAAGDDAATLDLLADFARDLPLALPISDRRIVVGLLPPSLTECAEAELLRADIVFATAPMRADGPLQAAIDTATEQDRPEVTVLALLRLGDMAYRSGDRAGLETARRRLERLEALGGTGATAALVLTESWLRMLNNASESALRLMESPALRGYPPVASMADYYRAVLLGHAGRARASLDALAELSRTPDARILERRGGFAGLMRWWCGTLDAAGRQDAAELLTRLGDDHQQHLVVEGAASTALFYASAGDLERARALVDQAVSKRDRVPDEAWGAITTELALAVIDLMEGDEAAATIRLEATLPATGPFDGFARHVFGNVGALLYALVPRARPFFDEETTGPDLQVATDVGRALVALREHGSAAPAARLPWEDLDRLRTWAYEPHLAELAIAAMSHGVLRANVAISGLRNDPRGALRTVVDRHDDPVASLAREELDRTPHRPALTTYVQVMGPTLVSVGAPGDGDTPPVRRKMVRELLLLLVHRRRLRRDEIAALMWPDKDEHAARNNLRATLNHLRTLLESDADDADDGPPWHVRSDGESLELFVSDRLVIDALEFDAAVAAARRADLERRPAEALAHCLEAIGRYAGPYLDDALDPDWAFNQRMTHHLDFVDMCVRASELREARGEASAAADLARRAVDAEPLSERAHRALCRALRASGDRAAARRAYERCGDVLAAEGLSPDDETRRLGSQL
jgi:DNA-binding SARP family transcriptional activator/ATP/maltotriose-dependent transcriptional regulator MalT